MIIKILFEATRRMETLKQFIRPFCKPEKSITYLKFGCSYRCGNAFRKTMMTRHILIPVRIFFILGRQFAPSRESRTHVLKFLARTLASETDPIKFKISSKTPRGENDSTNRHHHKHHKRQPGEQQFPIQVVTG